jgi:hypothetical protein
VRASVRAFLQQGSGGGGGGGGGCVACCCALLGLLATSVQAPQLPQQPHRSGPAAVGACAARAREPCAWS